LRRSTATPATVAAIAVFAVAGVVAIAVGWSALSASGSSEPTAAQTVAAPAIESTVTVSEPLVEVPSLEGLSLEQAEALLSAAGMPVQITPEDPLAPEGVDTVIGQKPSPGELVESGTTVALVVRTVAPARTDDAGSRPAAENKKPAYVVCIDPGHQARSNSAPEPIGPGAKTVKPKVTGGATGVKTRIPEYEIVLQVSMNLKRRLEAQGVEVVMTRTTNDVNLSNSERAAIANEAKADLLVRVHGDGSTDSKAAGLSTLYTGRNRWTKSFSADSKRAARAVQAATIASTGAVDRGIIARQDLSGFNYAKMPAILVETGFLSNPVEDRLLASPHYQDKVAEGIATGVLAYLVESGKR